MGILQDLLKEVPLSAVLKERVALAEEKYRAAIDQVDTLKKRVTELEGANLRLKGSAKPDCAPPLKDDTKRVLIALFKASTIEDRDVGALARAMQMDRSVLQYHLDRLDEARFAACTGGNYLHGHTYWALTSEGRQFAVEGSLV
jgi:DNA-binding MarR family transcriptional regulator